MLQPGHIKRNCRFWVKCRGCHLVGHIERYCKSRTKSIFIPKNKFAASFRWVGEQPDVSAWFKMKGPRYTGPSSNGPLKFSSFMDFSAYLKQVEASLNPPPDTSPAPVNEAHQGDQSATDMSLQLQAPTPTTHAPHLQVEMPWPELSSIGHWHAMRTTRFAPSSHCRCAV